MPSTKTEIVNLVDRVIKGKESNTLDDIPRLESEIDKLVYKIYGLSEEDCSIIEESFKQVVLQ